MRVKNISREKAVLLQNLVDLIKDRLGFGSRFDAPKWSLSLEKDLSRLPIKALEHLCFLFETGPLERPEA